MTDNPFPVCPIPKSMSETVQMAHGGGGRAMQRMIDEVFHAAFDNAFLKQSHDGAVVDLNGRCALTTDSYVVWPLTFPGGDIGRLAVNGTVNDLAMCGARPRYLTAGFVLEEGLAMSILIQIVTSMAEAATAAGIQIVTGDTKVVDRGKADGLYINSAGIGELMTDELIAPASVKPGDAIIISGDIGRHGIAVMAAREDLGFESEITSDCAPLTAAVISLLEAGVRVHCLRDLTRGGLASALVEVAETAGLSVRLTERDIPIREDVRAACELLGLDPLYVANEGRFVAFVDQADTDKAIAILHQSEIGSNAACIGYIENAVAVRVSMQGALGARRVVDMLSGEQLPRIC